MARRRYNRASIGDTMRVAQLTARESNQLVYVYATAYGYAIEFSPPPPTQRYYLIEPCGNIGTAGYEPTSA